MKLELGSGDRPTPGYVHLDIRRDAPDVNLVGDARDLGWLAATTVGPQPIPASCEEIRATHLLEHFSHRETVKILRHWRGYLKPGGRLYIEVPNLTGHIAAWQAGRESDAQLVVYLFGEQDHEHNVHRTMFTAGTLRQALHYAGLIVTRLDDIGLVLIAEAMR